jgi:hypothetical protein
MKAAPSAISRTKERRERRESWRRLIGFFMVAMGFGVLGDPPFC